MNGLELMEFYADPASGSWGEVGYRPYPLGPPTGVPAPVRPRITTVDQVRPAYDVVVVGSGAGGGVAARVLAEAGASVLVVERGTWLDREAPGLNHLRNHRLPALGDGTSPEGHVRAALAEDGTEETVPPHDMRAHNNAFTVGGGTRVFGAQAWRFHPNDFRMASMYGVPEGSALADWPITYDELEQYYDKVEWELGVAGEPSGVHPRQRGYPMAPWPLSLEDQHLAQGAQRLGWSTTRVPLLINTEARDGRMACVRCGFCVGFPCPVDAKNGSASTALPRATTAGAHLLTGAQVVRVSDSGDVEFVVDGVARTVRAGRVALAGGAVETARLLQLSRLGNDWVGDCLQGHSYAGALGLFKDVVIDGLGPGPSIATLEFVHGNDSIVGGGMLANEFVKLPALHYSWALPPDSPREGDAARQAVAETYRRTSHVTGPLQEVPTRQARVRLATSVTDGLGLPVARPEGLQHPEDLRSTEFLAGRAEAWLQASGAERIWRFRLPGRILSGGQHQAGTARMSDSPERGATDVTGKVWGTDRIYVVDGSVHVTNGGVNPVLTIMATAWRTADGMVDA